MDKNKSGERRFLRRWQVLQIIPISKSSWHAGIRAGRYPKPIKLSERTSAWRKEDIDALCDKLAARDATTEAR